MTNENIMIGYILACLCVIIELSLLTFVKENNNDVNKINDN